LSAVLLEGLDEVDLVIQLGAQPLDSPADAFPSKTGFELSLSNLRSAAQLTVPYLPSGKPLLSAKMMSILFLRAS
jgi:hypothetical protein